MEKNKLVLFIVMLVTTIISIFSLSKTVEVENIVKSQAEIAGAAAFSIKILADNPLGTAPHEVKFSSLVINVKSGVKLCWEKLIYKEEVLIE